MYNDLNRFAIGFDSIFEQLNGLQRGNSYPPHNVIKISDSKYLLEFAVAGFGRDNIEISQEEGFLIIIGTASNKNREYLHKGISERDFESRFKLADHVDVIDAELNDGLLHVTIEKQIPEELKPKQIAIK